jgi:hypothetical protein
MTQAKRSSFVESRSKATPVIMVDLSVLSSDKFLTVELPSSPPPPYHKSSMSSPLMSSGFPSTDSVSFYSSDSEEQLPNATIVTSDCSNMPGSPLSQEHSPLFLSFLRAIEYGPNSPNNPVSRIRRRFSSFN